jgi:hypothetical protein
MLSITPTPATNELFSKAKPGGVLVSPNLLTLSAADARKLVEASGAALHAAPQPDTNLVLIAGPDDPLVSLGYPEGLELVDGDAEECVFVDEAGIFTLAGRPGAPAQVPGPLGDWVARLDAKIAQLRAHPDIQIVSYAAGPPVSEARIAAAEQKLGGKLPVAMANLYRQADGLSLLWIDKKWPYHEEHGEVTPLAHRRAHYKEVISLESRLQGCINILPFEAMLWGQSWEDEIWFDHMEGDELAFAKGLRVIDYYNFYNMAALGIHPDLASAQIHIGGDHGASFSDVEPMSAEDYFEHVLARAGARTEASELSEILEELRDSETKTASW